MRSAIVVKRPLTGVFLSVLFVERQQASQPLYHKTKAMSSPSATPMGTAFQRGSVPSVS